MNTEQQAYLQAIGIQLWEEKRCRSNMRNSKELGVKATELNKENSKTCSDQTMMASDWNTLEQNVLDCILCELSRSRTKVVFGVGDRQTDLMIVGEAPGANEDLQGLPFVGRAGLLLTSILQSIGLKREDVYITNILKCRPPQNRDPFPREIDCCTPYLKQQITFIKPKMMVAVGRVAAQFLLNTKESLGRLRGKQHHYGEHKTPLIITYHPAYLLRSPKEKAKAYEDWKWIQDFLGKMGPR